MQKYYLVVKCTNGLFYPQISMSKLDNMPIVHTCLAYTGCDARRKFLEQGFIKYGNNAFYFTLDCIKQLFCGIDDVNKMLK